MLRSAPSASGTSARGVVRRDPRVAETAAAASIDRGDHVVRPDERARPAVIGEAICELSSPSTIPAERLDQLAGDVLADSVALDAEHGALARAHRELAVGDRRQRVHRADAAHGLGRPRQRVRAALDGARAVQQHVALVDELRCRAASARPRGMT